MPAWRERRASWRAPSATREPSQALPRPRSLRRALPVFEGRDGRSAGPRGRDVLRVGAILGPGEGADRGTQASMAVEAQGELRLAPAPLGAHDVDQRPP